MCLIHYKIYIILFCKICLRHKCIFVLFIVRALEKAKITGNFAAETCEVTKSEGVPMPGYNDTESESSDSETSRTVRQSKKLKVGGLHH